MGLVRVIAFGVIATGISFGARQTYFSVGTSRVLGREVDADLKLAFLGIFNKSLDVLILSSLEYTASMLLTIWMASTNPPGATFEDFNLKEELTKPWMTVIRFGSRWRRTKWTWKSFFRFLVCLMVSVSVLLQGLAINTIALPKERWYPDPDFFGSKGMPAQARKAMTLEHPRMPLHAIDWNNLLEVGNSSTGTEDHLSLNWAFALSASLAFSGLRNATSTVSLPQKAWQHVYEWQLDDNIGRQWCGLHTAFDTSRRLVETISLDSNQVMDLFTWLRKVGHDPTSTSIGWSGSLTLVQPVLNTLCNPLRVPTSEDSITVTLPPDSASGDGSFDVHLGPVSATSFTGVTCHITFRQGLFPVDFWIINMGRPGLHLNNWGSNFNKTLIYEPGAPHDADIALALATQLQSTIPRMQGLMVSESLLKHFLLMSRKMQHLDPAIESDATGLAIILGVLAQNLLTLGNKHRSPLPDTLLGDPGTKVTSFPLQWQLYGSGPREVWQWATVAVLAILVASLCFSLFLTLRYWMGPGSWAELDGMMMIAHGSRDLKDMNDEAKARERSYRIEKRGVKLSLENDAPLSTANIPLVAIAQ